MAHSNAFDLDQMAMISPRQNHDISRFAMNFEMKFDEYVCIFTLYPSMDLIEIFYFYF